jgi:hypothetical protein
VCVVPELRPPMGLLLSARPLVSEEAAARVVNLLQ